MKDYYVSKWALLRQVEIIDLPEKFEIHSDYSKILSKEKIVSVVKNIRRLFINIYQDIADSPERFKMPMIEIIAEDRTKMGAPPAKALSSKTAPFMLFNALINLLICGDIENGELRIDDCGQLQEKNKEYLVKNVDALYSQFDTHGLRLDGLTNYKLTKDTTRIVLSYPDDPDMLVVLKWMADKAHNFTTKQENRRRDFMLCQYRLLQDGIDSLHYGFGADYLSDRLHTKAEQNCVNEIDAELRKIGLIPCVDTGEDNSSSFYSLLYYKSEEDKGKFEKSNFRVSANICQDKLEGMKLPCVSSTQAKLYLRIRTKNIQNGAEHIKKCSEQVQNLFIPGDKGCRDRGSCIAFKIGGGQAYVIDGIEYWKCGCHNGKFITLQPRSEDIADYIKLAELFNK